MIRRNGKTAKRFFLQPIDANGRYHYRAGANAADTARRQTENITMTSTNVLLFVYGTLRSDADNSKSHLLGGRLLAANASIRGTLHDYGLYPGVVLDGGGAVKGEVWSVPKANLARLDRYEGSEYVRVVTDVVYRNDARRPLVLHGVMVYEAVDPTGFPAIPCGDWVERHATA